MLQEIEIKNINRSRKWGWGWSCTPTGEDAYSIEKPSRPDYTGTLNQLMDARANDRTWQSMRSGGTFTNTTMFFDGKPIHSTWTFGVLNGKSCDDPNVEWGYGWFAGLHLPDPEIDDVKNLKIRVEVAG